MIKEIAIMIILMMKMNDVMIVMSIRLLNANFFLL